MKNTTDIFIVTPSFNSEKYINRTITSVISQTGNFSINYHIQDGGSKDGTVKILETWKKIIDAKEFPISCTGINFTFASEKDDGMYDAIFKGFKAREHRDSWWLSWINSDDYFLPGAFAHLELINKTSDLKQINWITPYTPAIAKDNIPINNISPRPISKYLISEGLCDGTHWDFIQQEGTFFRSSLWNKVDTINKFRKLKYAGDWSLWKEMARHEKIYQTSSALAVFNIIEGQLSATHRSDYLKEIEKLNCNKSSIEKLQKIAQNDTEAMTLSTNWKTQTLTLGKINLKDAVLQKISKLKNTKLAKLEKIPEIHNNIISYDYDWQYPAITEKHCFEKMRSTCTPPENVIYIAFPWATLIDLKHNKKDHSLLDEALAQIYEIKKERNHNRLITVCQHIFAKKFIAIFRALGITDLFWTHACKNEEVIDGISIHPLPLFPVQQENNANSKHLSEKGYLFSFMGARDDKWYLTNTRSIILDELSHPKAMILGKNEWHYKKVVYDEQIYKSTSINSIDSTDEKYKEVLRNSLFSLCPSGSGPNSIRLWEAIQFDSIPVILADTYLPPGPQELWTEAAIFCKEEKEEILLLPKKLEELSQQPDILERKIQALQQLKLLYGPETFITDIVKLLCTNPNHIIEKSTKRKTPTPLDIDVSAKIAKRVQLANDINKTNSNASICSSFLVNLSSDIVINCEEFLKMYENIHDIRKAIRFAIKNAPPQITQHFLKTASLRNITINL